MSRYEHYEDLGEISPDLSDALAVEEEIHDLFKEGKNEGDRRVIQCQLEAGEKSNKLGEDESSDRIIKDAFAKKLWQDRKEMELQEAEQRLEEARQRLEELKTELDDVSREVSPYLERVDRIPDPHKQAIAHDILSDPQVFTHIHKVGRQELAA